MFLLEAQRKGTWKFPCFFEKQEGKEHGISHFPLRGTAKRNMEVPMFLCEARRLGTWKFP